MAGETQRHSTSSYNQQILQKVFQLLVWTCSCCIVTLKSLIPALQMFLLISLNIYFTLPWTNTLLTSCVYCRVLHSTVFTLISFYWSIFVSTSLCFILCAKKADQSDWSWIIGDVLRWLFDMRSTWSQCLWVSPSAS